MNKILGFSGEYRWLSNFYRLEYPIEVNGYNFYTIENLYQAFKCAKQDDFPYFADITPVEAKKLGRTIELINGWDSMKLDVMRELQIIKYSQPKFRDLLIQTGDAYIEETNWWNDTFYGVCNGIGENHLGKIIMEIRNNL